MVKDDKEMMNSVYEDNGICVVIWNTAIMGKFSTFLMKYSVDYQTTQMRTRNPENSRMELFVTIINGLQGVSPYVVEVLYLTLITEILLRRNGS